MKYKATTIYKGMVAIRSDRVEKCIEKQENLEISFKGNKVIDHVIIPLGMLKYPAKLTGPFKSRYSGSYSLYYYPASVHRTSTRKAKPVHEEQEDLFI